MQVHKTIKEHFIAKGLGDGASPWKWWKDNLLDCDSEVGVVLVKTRASQESPITTHDITEKGEDDKLGLRTYATERLENLLTTSKGAVYAQEFDKLLTQTVSEANELQEFVGENGQ